MALPAPADGSAPSHFGVYPALVTSLMDPEERGRVEVRYPWLGTDGDRDVRPWATLCTPYADDDQGLAVLPEVGSQVVVAFEAGNLLRPYIIGSCWNGRTSLARPPEQANNIRVLRSRSKSELEFDDTAGSAKVSITMRSGHRIVLDEGAQDVTIQHTNGSKIHMTAAGAIEIQATLSVDVKASMVNVTAPIATFSGIVQCKTLMADAFVISPAYTPGVGNLL
jgi:uncharacterized protein involved in type VI secretion and phage assembly